MAEGPYLMGIDYGTGGVRVGIFDVEGTPVVFHGVEFETSYPRSGWAEQDPDTWWSSLVQAVHGAMEQSGVASDADRRHRRRHHRGDGPRPGRE